MKKLKVFIFSVLLCSPLLAHADEKRTYCISDNARLSAQQDGHCEIGDYPVVFMLGNKQTARINHKYSINKSSAIQSYYERATGKEGESLRTALNSIIQHDKHFSYRDVWSQLEYTDEDPINSNNVITLYSGDSLPKNAHAGGGKNINKWNREHVWAKSHGFPKENQFAYTDLHHLRPARVEINSKRGNKDFDIGGMPIKESKDNKTDNDSFEPADSVKGDVSRMLFYMDVRYEGNDGSRVGDLRLVDKITKGRESKLGKLCTLLAWHLADPVSDLERRRNERIYERQGNRNPFIDHPEWVMSIYGNHCNS